MPICRRACVLDFSLPGDSDLAGAGPGVIARMKERMRGQPRGKVGNFWGMTYLLMGLRYEQTLINELLEGVIGMEESVTYQAILARGMAEGQAKGALEEARKTLVLLGRERFGAPRAKVREAIKGITDLERLERLQVRLLKAASWEELLNLSRRATRKRKKTS